MRIVGVEGQILFLHQTKSEVFGGEMAAFVQQKRIHSIHAGCVAGE